MELGAHLFGVWVTQLLEGLQGTLPGAARRVWLSGVLVEIAEVDLDDGFVVAVAERPGQVERFLVVRGRLPVMAEVVVGVAEGVGRGGLAEPVANLPQQRQRLLAVYQGLLVFAEHGVVPADGVERVGLPNRLPARRNRPSAW